MHGQKFFDRLVAMHLCPMRFLPHEHRAITDRIQQHGIDLRTVLFVKRRGRLHVEMPDRVDPFIFFREERTILDAQGCWQGQVEYFVGMAKRDPTDWHGVMVAFETWMDRRPEAKAW